MDTDFDVNSAAHQVGAMLLKHMNALMKPEPVKGELESKLLIAAN